MNFYRAAALKFASFVLFSSLITASTLLGSAPYAAPAVQPDNGSLASPEQQLEQCVETAKSGNVDAAFESAMRIHKQFQTQRMFDVSYINTLLTIVDECDSKIEPKILNEVIGLVNKVRSTKQYDGAADPEIAFHFMKALGRLSKLTLEFNERVSSKVRIYEGLIALNLSKNPSFPQNASESLSLPLVSMSQGYAIRGDKKNAFKALRIAVDKGFGDFEMIAKDPLINRLGKRDLSKLTAELKPRYKKAVKKWAQSSVAGFSTSQLYFDLPNIRGGRLSNADFAGKVVVLDMWATWCPPCRKGIPHFVELQKKYGDRGVAVFGVAMDNPQNPSSALPAVEKFAAKQKFNYPCALGDTAFSQSISGKPVLPTTIFMDSLGNVRYIARGYHDYAKLEAITNVLVNESQPIRTTMPSLSN